MPRGQSRYCDQIKSNQIKFNQSNTVSLAHLAPDLAISDIPGKRVKWSDLTNVREVTKGGFSIVYSAMLGNARVAVKQYVPTMFLFLVFMSDLVACQVDHFPARNSGSRSVARTVTHLGSLH